VVIGAKGGENVVHKDITQRGRSTKVEKMLFTKIELKAGEAQRGRKMLFTKIDSKG
jgi:hypothetical protein